MSQMYSTNDVDLLLKVLQGEGAALEVEEPPQEDSPSKEEKQQSPVASTGSQNSGGSSPIQAA